MICIFIICICNMHSIKFYESEKEKLLIKWNNEGFYYAIFIRLILATLFIFYLENLTIFKLRMFFSKENLNGIHNSHIYVNSQHISKKKTLLGLFFVVRNNFSFMSNVYFKIVCTGKKLGPQEIILSRQFQSHIVSMLGNLVLAEFLACFQFSLPILCQPHCLNDNS